MKVRSVLIPVLFVIVALILGGTFYITKNVLGEKENSVTRAKIINPKSASASESESDKKVSLTETEKFETFVPLFPTETLIGTLTIDFNNDGYDDEVVLVRKVGSEFMWIVPGVYNLETGNYDRLDQIVTPFSRTRTFSYFGMDVIGDHTTALVYQGLDDADDYVMNIFLCKMQPSGKLKLESVGDFSSDGTVFIQQTERSESYELGISKGESYSIWVYKSELPDENETVKKDTQNLNQIQQEYKWNSSSQKYELAQEIKVTARRLAAKELSKIQDGTVETFANFLDGLWYKVSNEDGNIRYLYFDYATKEIILFVGEVQEVYEWQDSRIRHNGMLLTTVNTDIMNLHRRFDVSLVKIDEIVISIRDYINLNISQSSTWDGSYKKMNIQSTFNTPSAKTEADIFKAELKKEGEWISIDETLSIKFDDMTYALKMGEITESGIYAVNNIGQYTVLQLRSDTEHSNLQEYYALSFGVKVVTETVKRKTVEKTVTDYNSLTLSPIKVTPTDCFAAEGRILNFNR